MTLSEFVFGGVIIAICLGLGTVPVQASIGVRKLPVSINVPLTHSNTLAAILVGATALAEWRNLNLSLVALGTLPICTGAAATSLSR